MLIDCVISPSVQVYCNGLGLYLWSLIVSASKNVIVLPTWNVRLAGSTHARGCIILFRPTLSLVQSLSEPDV